MFRLCKILKYHSSNIATSGVTSSVKCVFSGLPPSGSY